MTDGKIVANCLFQQIVNIKPTRAKLGYGSFVTIDFGKDIPEEVKTRQGTQMRYHGEWHLWIYKCKWQIDQDGEKLVDSESPKEAIESTLYYLTNKTLTSFKLLNDFYDAELNFENMPFKTFHTKEGEQWMLFSPENKTFVSGPLSHWEYRNSDYYFN